MIAPGTGVRVYLACGVTDMRKGINGLSALAKNVLRQKPTGGAVFAFRGRRGDRIKLLYWDGQPSRPEAPFLPAAYAALGSERIALTSAWPDLNGCSVRM